jgi:tRNA pseudouridine(55) synthase
MYNVSIHMRKNTLYLQKEKGETPLSCIERFRVQHKEYEGVPMTYAGRLDPIASGELLVLAGEECKRKDEYLGLDKEYEATVLLGVQTDSYDVLGIPVDSQSGKVAEVGPLQIQLEKMVGVFDQPYPPYSSKTVKGKQLHTHAREGGIGDIEIPTKRVEIYSIETISFETISKKDIQREIYDIVDRVSGDFRQEEIKTAWESVIASLPKTLLTVTFIVNASSGTYVRSIAHRLGGTLLRLHRIRMYTHT